MALETSRQRLVTHLRDACEKLSGLEVTVGDHPDGETPALVDLLDEAVLDAHGRVEDALAAAARLAAADGGAHLTETARATLPAIQQALHRAIFDCLLNLSAPAHSAELARIARLRGGEWTSWVKVIRPALAGCVRVLEPAHSLVGECWCDFFERVAPWPSAVHQVVNICHRDPALSPGNLEPQPSKT
jgi:hypothetical protein